jgi:hypothetical protein
MFPDHPNIISQLNQEWGLAIQSKITEDDLAALLGTRINELIRKDLSHLIAILYRIDVDEKKIREMLVSHPGTDAGLIIAHLVIERQKQKIKTRELFKPRVDDVDEEEKW